MSEWFSWGSAGSDGGPAGSDGGPADSVGGPAGSDGDPPFSDGGPTGSNGGPAGSDRGPVGSDGVLLAQRRVVAEEGLLVGKVIFGRVCDMSLMKFGPGWSAGQLKTV